jgi:hypothetical protein
MLPRPGECRGWNDFAASDSGSSLPATLIYNTFAASVQMHAICHSDIDRRLSLHKKRQCFRSLVSMRKQHH